MRKLSILLVVALVATSCAVGTYYPYARNNFGAQSTVVLDKANFRVVRDVEAIVDVNNTRLSRADVASSAYGELLRKAQLTGSQVLINVVIEEVRRESAGFFRLLFGMPKRVQHVAARATIIEFLDENGNPRVSESYRPTNTHTTTVTAKPTNNSNASVAAQEVETTNSNSSVQSTIQLPPHIQLHSLPDGTRDEVDIKTGILTRNVGCIVLDGSETWYSIATVNNNVRFYTKI